LSGKSVKSSVKGFRSQAELAQAISDPRYVKVAKTIIKLTENIPCAANLIQL